jgi:hypothetical protein
VNPVRRSAECQNDGHIRPPCQQARFRRALPLPLAPEAAHPRDQCRREARRGGEGFLSGGGAALRRSYQMLTSLKNAATCASESIVVG